MSEEVQEVHQCEYYKIKETITKKGTGKYKSKTLIVEITNKERCKRTFKDASSLKEYTLDNKIFKYCHSHYPGQLKYSTRHKQTCKVFTEYMAKMSPDVDHMGLLYRWTNCRGKPMSSDLLMNILSYVDDSIRMPYNFSSGAPYTGVNAMNLMVATIKDFKAGNITGPENQGFGTLNQWNANGFVMRSDIDVYPYYVTRGCSDTFITYPIYRSLDMVESDAKKKKKF